MHKQAHCDSQIPNTLNDALDIIVLESMKIMSAVMLAIYSIFTIFGVTGLIKTPLYAEIIFDAAVALYAVMLVFFLFKKKIHSRFANLVVILTIFLIQLNLLVSSVLNNSYHGISFIPFLIVGIGALLLSVKWFAFTLIGVLASTVPIIVFQSIQIEEIDLILDYIPSFSLSIAIFLSRKHSHTRLYHFRVEDADSKKQLKEALEQIEISFQEHKKAEIHRRNLENHLRQVQKLEAIGVLAGGIAHGMNNLLGAIAAYASLAIDKTKSDDPIKSDIEEILSASERGAELTRNLLGFARKGRVQKDIININNSIEKVYSVLKPTISKNIDIQLDLDSSIKAISGDPGQISQIIMNLCINSSHAMPNGGTITVFTKNVEITESSSNVPLGLPVGSYVFISVKDTGCGMDKETREQAFDPFFTTKQPDEGTGLGLAMVYGSVQSHGGEVSINSSIGQGTEVNIYLPSCQFENNPSPKPQTSPSQYTYSDRTVLLVDDEPMIRSAVSRLLQRLGCKVLCAENGEDALLVYEKHKDVVQMVILDIAMPIMSGPECFKKLRELNSQIPIAISSGFSDESQTEPLLAMGATTLLPKPYDLYKLADLIERTIPRT